MSGMFGDSQRKGLPTRRRQGAFHLFALVTAAVVLATVVTPTQGATAAEAVSPPSAISAPAIPASASALAANASDFDPGYIVSDENFYDGTAMTAAGVQSFILSKNSACNSTYACLWGYGQSTPTMDASRYCQALPGTPSSTAAAIIAAVGRACNISQRALLVLLEKEQGLVTAVSPTKGKFESATGFNCPDTAPCDPSYAGFFFQVYNAARQFQVYRALPASFNHRPNAVNNILYHPNRACGSSAVFIRNAATAGLYNYTPYQPNASALANMYGVGDSCGAYGNRNFFRMWTDWFGSPTSDPYDIIRPVGTDYTYLVSGGLRYAFMSPEIFAQYSAMAPIREVSLSVFYSKWTDGAQVQRGLRSSDGAVYLIDANKRYRFTGCDQARDFGQECGDLPMVTPAQAAKIPDAGYVSSLVGLPDGSKWLMQGGARREVFDASILAQYGISATPTQLSNYSIGGNQIGSPVLTAGLYTDGRGAYRAATGAGQLNVLPAAVTGALAASARSIHPYSFDRMVSDGSLPLRLTSDGRYFIAVAGGWLETSGPLYGTANFASLRSGAWIGIPVVGAQASPHFIRERSSAQVYLISGGYRQAVKNATELDQLAATYGVPKRVWVAADGALEGLGEHSSLTSGTVVRTSATAPTYLVDGARLIVVPRLDYAQLLGFGKSVNTVSVGVINGFSDRTASLDRTVISCGGVDYLGTNGQRFSFAVGARAAWAMPAVPLADTTCALIPVAGTPVGQNLIGPDGRQWYVDGGKRHQVIHPAARALLAARYPQVAVSNEAVGQLAAGPDAFTGAGQGQNVQAPNGRTYTVDGARLLWLQRWETSIDLGMGLPQNVVRVDAGFMALFPAPDVQLDRVAVTCNGVPSLGVNGRILPFDSPATARAWAVPSVTLSGACTNLTKSTTPVTPYFRTLNGQVWAVIAGQRSPVYGWPAMDRLKVIATGYLDVGDEVSRLLPIGPTISE
jgi:hypothetical protein